jgi:cobalt-zinc-cadmium efflux system outer membrane protein
MGQHTLVMFVLLFGLLAGGGVAFAQSPPAPGPVTVDQVVERAVADNLELRAMRAEVDAARGRLLQAGLRPNPMLDLGGQANVSGPDNNVNIGLSIPLDLNGRKAGRVGVAEREIDMKQAQVSDRERRLSAEVRLKAGDLLAARRNLEFTEELLGTNQKGLGLVRDRVQQGAAPTLEENLVLVEVNRLEASLSMLKSRVEILGLQLRLLAGMPPDEAFSLQGELASHPLTLDRTQALAQGLAGRPDVVIARAEAAMAQAKIRREEAEGRWDARFNLGYQRQDFGFSLNGLTDRGGTRPIQDTFNYVGGGVTITVPVRNKNQGNVAAATAEAQAAERKREGAELIVRQEVAAAFAQLDAAQRALDIYTRGVRDVAGRNLAVVRQAYELGRTSVLDVIAEQRRYIDIEMGYTDALKLVYDAGIEIQRATAVRAR